MKLYSYTKRSFRFRVEYILHFCVSFSSNYVSIYFDSSLRYFLKYYYLKSIACFAKFCVGLIDLQKKNKHFPRPIRIIHFDLFENCKAHTRMI